MLRDINVSQALMEERGKLIERQQALTLVEDLLALNFIFSRQLSERIGLSDGILNDIYDVEILPTSPEFKEFLSRCAALETNGYESFYAEFIQLASNLSLEPDFMIENGVENPTVVG
ncbi:hypothetical protein BGX31_008659, partial [Mortierella sp. GBA43]